VLASVGILLNNLADVVQAQKKYAEAEKLHRRVLSIFEKTYGDDPKTAASLNNLGAVLQAQERYADAEPVLAARAGDEGKNAGFQ